MNNLGTEVAQKIIMDNAEIADYSMADFIAQCFKSCQNNQLDVLEMTSSLIKVLTDGFGSFKDIVDIIVNDEGYFTWRMIDDYNSDINVREIHSLVSAAYVWMSIVDKEAYYSYKPNIDWAMRPIVGMTKIFKGSFPYMIGSSSGYRFNDVKRGKFPKDGHIGIIISKDDYPNAMDLGKEPHLAFPYVNDTGGCKLTEEGEVAPLENTYAYPLFDNYPEVRNPGLIYVPAKKYIKTAFKDASSNRMIGTCLPRHILDKHGLPVLE